MNAIPSSNRSLHILYIVQYFNALNEAGGTRAFQFAEQWARRGHRVTVLTGNLNHKTLSTTTDVPFVHANVRVIRVKTFNRIRGSFKRRVLNFVSFALQATFRAVTIRDVDLVYASSTPLTTGLAGYLVSLLKRRPFFFEVRDLWPESAVVAGVLKEGRAVRFIEWFERRFYAHATKVVALTEGIRDGVIRKGKAANDVLFVPNGMDDWMLEVVPSKSIRSPFDADAFLCIYLGAHGRWNKLETMLEAAAQVRETRVRFLFVGDGDYKPELQAYARRLALSNVHFHDAVPKSDIFEYIALADVTLICTWDHEFQRMVLANKVFDYMAAGRPIVAAARGETADLVERADCGWTVPPERPAELAALLDRLSALPRAELRRKGGNGLEYARTHYRRSHLADALHQTFLQEAS